MLYVGNRHTAVASGRTTKTVRCEKCGETYCYRMVRRAQGEGRSPYFLDEDGAADRAARRAAKTLQKKLERGCEPVACPDCGHYQAHMVAQLRRRRYGWIMWVGIFVPLAALVGFAMYASDKRVEPSDDPSMLAAGLGAPLLVATALFLVRWHLARNWDPNVDPPEPRDDTPRAFRPMN
ncbi:MAG TPA: hypothetical protein VF796_19160 [Humisphaera sp.]